MFMVGCKRYPILYNKSILDYCMKSTQESIKKMTEKKSLEKEIKQFQCNDDDDNNSSFNFYRLLLILYVSSLGIYFYKKLK
jgi:hypothetical protein